ncbi:MAG TPA: hypothetical protein VMH39_03300 [Gemmatimonadaceae bacterium]|nr:hypothetical protein [Gemmatimonadaceae bacterium]
MTGMHALWIPIVLSSVIVFVASSIIHMMSPWHKGDYPMLPNQDAIMDALRPFSLAPGDYMLPRPESMADMKSAAFIEKVNRGPKVIMTVMPPGMTGMGQNLAGWFVYLLVVDTFAAYVAGRALPVGADYLHVFRFVGATAFLGFSLALWQLTIWYSRSMSITVKSTIDGLIYALLAAGTFGWLWPR